MIFRKDLYSVRISGVIITDVKIYIKNDSRVIASDSRVIASDSRVIASDSRVIASDSTLSYIYYFNKFYLSIFIAC